MGESNCSTASQQYRTLLVLVIEEQTPYQQAATGISNASSEGDTTVKRFSNDDTDGGSEVNKPYDGRGYC